MPSGTASTTTRGSATKRSSHNQRHRRCFALYLRGCALIGVALLAFLANAQLLSLLHNLWLWFALVLAQALGAAIAGRKCRSRLAIHGWLVGVALCVLIGVVALTYYEVTGRPITAIS